MKQLIIGIAIMATAVTACNNSNDTSSVDKKKDSAQISSSSYSGSTASNNADTKGNSSIQAILGQYLKMKDALANDNGKDAASAGNAFVESMGKMDKSSLAADKKKTWDDISDDAKEMAEHIGKNADKLEHQREHFDMLSKDMYDLVKAFGAGQLLYQDFCPMYNDKKGATWLSETKEIKNPYMGKKQPTCGSVKEEIK